jgi:DNA-binding transcriptional LysR family regulator
MRRPRIETFDLNLLRIFDALYQHGSVNSAASEIGVSPSAISHALGRLRHAFDDDLFVKGPGGMAPTARAAEISDRVSAIILQVQSVLGPPEFEPENTERHFKLNCIDYIGSIILPDVVKTLLSMAPNTTLTIDRGYTKSIVDDLDSGVVDLVVGAFNQIPDRFESEVLISDYWVWVLRADHPALSAELTTEKLLQLPQLVLATNEVGRSIDGIITDAGLERFAVSDKIFLPDVTAKSRYSTQIKGPIISTVSQVIPPILVESDLVALLPGRMASVMSKLHNIKAIRYDKKDNVLEHKMIWHRKHGADPAKAWLRSLLRASVAKLDDSRPS